MAKDRVFFKSKALVAKWLLPIESESEFIFKELKYTYFIASFVHICFTYVKLTVRSIHLSRLLRIVVNS